MQIVSFAGFVYPDYEPESNIPLQMRDNSIELRNGAYDADGDEVVVQSFQATKKFVLRKTETQSIDEQLDDLKRRFNRTGYLVAEMDNGEVRLTYAKTLSFDDDETPGALNEHVREVTHKLKVNYPFWLLASDLAWKWGEGIKRWGDPLAWGENTLTVNLTQLSTTFTIDAAPSTAPIRQGKLSFKPLAGSSCGNIRLSNARNQMSFEWSGELAAGDELIMTLLPQSIRKNGVDAFATFFWPDNQLEWIRLEPEEYLKSGQNPISIEFDSISGTVQFKWTYARHFLP